MSDVDVVVIGGGHNGLVAACFLARAGLSVTVLEKEPRLGGMTLSAPLIPEAPEHLVNPGAYENAYLRASGIVEELGLAGHGYREVDSAGWAWLGQGGETVLFQRDIPATTAAIAQHSRRDADSYRELIRTALKLLRIQDRYSAGPAARPDWRTVVAASALVPDRRLRSLLAGALTGTAADAICATFESEPMRGAFASIAAILGSPLAEGSALSILGTSLLHHKGAARPIGGMGGLIAALERCLNASGGSARTAAEVVSIAVAAGRAEGVVLADGSVINVRKGVIAAIPPQRVPALAQLDARIGERLRRAPANAAGVATLTVNLALRGRVELPRHQPGAGATDLRRPAVFTGTFDGVLEACRDCAANELSTADTWWLTIFTAMDPSQAPENQDVAQLYGPAPVTARGGWDSARAAAADALLTRASATAQGLTELEIGRYVESPEDLSRRTGTLNGCLYHVDHLPTRMGPLRPALGAGSHKTPLAGLYLSGAGTHPSGGVSGLPGRHAARRLLADG